MVRFFLTANSIVQTRHENTDDISVLVMQRVTPSRRVLDTHEALAHFFVPNGGSTMTHAA
jgi:hypothetical protein